MVLTSFLRLLWCILTGVDNKTVIWAYATTSLPMALLTIDSIFFGGIIVLTSILNSMSGKRESYIHVIVITRPMRSLSIGVAILLIANISSYLTSGWRETIAICYQIGALPAFMFTFYLLFQP